MDDSDSFSARFGSKQLIDELDAPAGIEKLETFEGG